MQDTPDHIVYQIKVMLLGVSPTIWRRLLVRSDSTIADLHFILHIAMGWTDSHLHHFRIHGKEYGIEQIGGIWFDDDPRKVRLGDFRLRINERFFYEYDFTDNWRHQIRVEAIPTLESHRHYPVLTGGRLACPPEDCGGPWAFMALREEHSLSNSIVQLTEMIEKGDNEEHYQELDEIRYWLTVDRFDHKTVNRRLKQYANGDEVCLYE